MEQCLVVGQEDRLDLDRSQGLDRRMEVQKEVQSLGLDQGSLEVQNRLVNGNLHFHNLHLVDYADSYKDKRMDKKAFISLLATC
jgi:hypothetical protein